MVRLMVARIHGLGRWLSLLGLCLPLGAAPVVTQEDADSLYHWAYSAAFGTGYYRIGDEEGYVLKVEPVVPLGLLKNRGVSTRLRLPFTFGYQSFGLRDIPDPISDLKTVTFVPGLDFDIPVKGSWVLKPYVHYGYGTQISGGESAQIYYFGINSYVDLPNLGDFEIKMINGLQWFGQVPNHGSSDSFARLVTGFEGNYRLGSLKIRGRQLYLKPHIAHYWYFNSLDFRLLLEPPVEIKQEFEIALAVGIEERISLYFFSFDRLGVAFKDGDDVQGIRIFLSTVFH